jgi:hypothetical protein
MPNAKDNLPRSSLAYMRLFDSNLDSLARGEAKREGDQHPTTAFLEPE